LDHEGKLSIASSIEIAETPLKIAVILPCHNEAPAIANVVAQFRDAIPGAEIYVIDNASTDRTAEVANTAGAVVIFEPTPGKGNAVRRGFAEIAADIYVIADGDGTYDAEAASSMIRRLVTRRLDMVVGARTADHTLAYRPGHKFGNRLFNVVVSSLFRGKCSDIFSGYRVLSRRFVKSFPALSHGFEIETELTVHSLELSLPTEEIPSRYTQRVEGTASKLKTGRDGIRILWTILLLTKQYRPFQLYGAIAFILAMLSLALGLPVVREFLETGLVPRLPTALLATGIMLLATLSFATGLVLHSVSRSALEIKRLFYLGCLPREKNF
jgi:glycosyltransferase involved in cell wall biosynthesis